MDWKLIIAALQANGMSQAEIGSAIGRSQAWVADVLKGRYDDIKWMDGEALRKLHYEKVTNRRTGPTDQRHPPCGGRREANHKGDGC